MQNFRRNFKINTKTVVCKIPCEYGEPYIGESGRLPRGRVEEH